MNRNKKLNDFLESLFKEEGPEGVVETFSFLFGAFVITEDGIVVGANADFLDLIEYKKSDLYGMHAAKLITPDEVPAMLARFASNDTNRYDLKLLTESSSVKNVIVSPRIFSTNGVLYRFAEFIDITDREKKRVLALRAKQIVENSPAILFVWEATDGWPVEYVSSNISQFGYSIDDFLSGRVVFETLIHGDDKERVTAEVEENSNSDTLEFQQEYRLVTSSGEARWVVDHTSIIRDDAGLITHYEGLIVDITDTKLAQLDFEKSHIMVSSATDLIALIDSQYRYIMSNKSYQNAFCKTSDEIIGETVSHLFGDDFFQSVLKPYLDRCLHGETVNYQAWIDLPCQGRRFLDFAYSPVLQGNSNSVVVVARDITDLEITTGKLKESEYNFRRIFEDAPLGICLTDSLSGNILRVNERFSEIAGRSAEELTSMNWQSITHPDDVQEDLDHMALLIAGEINEFDLHKRYVRPDDSIVWIDMTVAKVEIDQSAQPQHLCMINDITELQIAAKSLENSERKFRTIFEEAPVGIALIDSITTDILEANSRYAEIVGRSVEELNALDWLSITHPDDVQEDLDNMALLNAGEVSGFTMEKRYIKPDGSVVWVHMTIAPAPTGIKNYPQPHHLCMVHDITERKDKDERLLRFDRELRTLVNINQALIKASSEEALMQEICELLVEQGGYLLCWIGFAIDDEQKSVKPVAHHGAGKDYIDSLELSWADVPLGRGPTGTAIRTAEFVAEQDIHNDPKYELWRENALKHGYQSSIALPLFADGKVIAALNLYSSEPDHFDTEEALLLQEMASDIAYGIKNQRTSIARNEYAERLNNSLIQTVHAIALTVEQRDPYTSGHMDRVAELSVAIGKELNLSQEKLDGLHLAASIHDLGKIYIPNEMLNRPGKLSQPELEIIKTHPQVGYDIVKNIDFPWPIAKMILQHHERLDGSGYPNGAKEDEILFESQILAVADMIEAISSRRPYRAALGIEYGIEIIKKERGSKLNPEVVDACVKIIEKDGFDFTSSF